MFCDLMEVNGMRADCGRTDCVYWARLGQGSAERPQCALEYFNLVGSESDKLSRWLLEFKIKNRPHIAVDAVRHALIDS